MALAAVPSNAGVAAAEVAVPGMKTSNSCLFDIEIQDPALVEVQETVMPVEDGLLRDLEGLMRAKTDAEIEVHHSVQDVVAERAPEELPLEDLARDLLAHLPTRSEVVLRTANPAGAGEKGTGECLRNLRHVFIVCTVGDVEYMVDPCFKEQFSIVHPTEAFRRLMATLPAVVVLPAERVTAVVELLCRAMSIAFKAVNIEMPPWRRADAMLSKWQPRRSCDVVQVAAELAPAAPVAAAVAPVGIPIDLPAAPVPSRSEDSARNMFNMVSRAHATLGLPSVRARARPSTAGPAPARQAPIVVPAQQRSKNSPPSRLSEQLSADPTGQAVQVSQDGFRSGIPMSAFARSSNVAATFPGPLDGVGLSRRAAKQVHGEASFFAVMAKNIPNIMS